MSNISNKEIWQEAAGAGLLLGLFTVLCSFIGDYAAKIPYVGLLLSLVVWAVKFGGCIWLMYTRMLKFGQSLTEATKALLQRFGGRTALCSALICAGYLLLDLTVLHPGALASMLDSVMSGMAGSLDSNSRQALDSMIGSMPAILFVFQLVYCYVFGLVLSAVISPKVYEKIYLSR